MIVRITHHDDEHGDFIYERDAKDPFKWHLVIMGGRPANSKSDGRDIMWQTAIAVQQGVET